MINPEIAYGQVRYSTDEQLNGFKRALDEAPFLFAHPDVLLRMVEIELSAREKETPAPIAPTVLIADPLPQVHEPSPVELLPATVKGKPCLECGVQQDRGKYCSKECGNRRHRKNYLTRKDVARPPKKSPGRPKQSEQVTTPRPITAKQSAADAPAKSKRTCSSCDFGEPNSHAIGGFACRAAKAMTCKPGLLAVHWKARGE